MLRWGAKTTIIYMVPSPKIRVVDVVRAAVKYHSVGTADPTESEIPSLAPADPRVVPVRVQYACRRPKPFDIPDGLLLNACYKKLPLGMGYEP